MSDPCADNGPCPTDASCDVTLGGDQVVCVCENSGYIWDETNNECAGTICYK